MRKTIEDTSVEDHFGWSTDGVRLHGRLYSGDASRPALLCIPGMTGNARDFEAFAAHFAPRFRVAALSLRGRGESGYAADPLTYVPLIYIRDIERMMGEMGLDHVVIVGSSLGGAVGMLMEAVALNRIDGLILNDIGPDVAAAGLERTQAEFGKGGNWPTWLHAARDMQWRRGDFHPHWTLEDWLAKAHRLCRVSREGRIVWDYDPQIAAPLTLPRANSAIDLWLALDQFRDRPVLVLRGADSDMLTPETVARMHERLPDLTSVTVPDAGHTPALDEPEALAAIDAFLRRFETD